VSRSVRTIGGVVLAVLISLPIAGTVCGLLCESGATHHAGDDHHGAGLHQADGPPSSARSTSPVPGTMIAGVSLSDCGNHDGLLDHASVSPRRADSFVTSCVVATTASHVADSRHLLCSVRPNDLAPPDTAPPSAPLVLRI
jgi:hypothetical protein